MISRLTLRAKFVLILNLCVASLATSAAIMAEIQQRNAIIEEVRKRADILALGLADASRNSLLTYNYVGVEQSLALAQQSPDVVYARVWDKERRIAAKILNTPAREEAGEKDVFPEGLNPVTRERRVAGLPADIVYEVTVPVMAEGSSQRWGTVQLGLSLASMNERIASSRRYILGLGLFAILIASLGSVILSGRITRPLQALTQAVAAVGHGDLGQRIAVETKDEIGQLGHAFNEMILKLARMRELEEHVHRIDRLAALGTMAAGIAHDIRNPLTSILIFSQLMSAHHDDPEIREKFNRVVPRELERVQSVIEDMMELARPGMLKREPVNVNDILEQLLELFENQASAQGVKIVREYAAVHYCLADRKRLHRCFSNFVSNAIQAMPEGGELTVKTILLDSFLFPRTDPQPEPAVQVIIADTGKGIPGEVLQRIFDPFFTTKEKGLGLGMAIAHRIVEDHNGAIDVKSDIGQGTRFSIALPARG
jgi:signal transduction histidine kinase